jgi:hypothetical protein
LALQEVDDVEELTKRKYGDSWIKKRSLFYFNNISFTRSHSSDRWQLATGDLPIWQVAIATFLLPTYRSKLELLSYPVAYSL